MFSRLQALRCTSGIHQLGCKLSLLISRITSTSGSRVPRQRRKATWRNSVSKNQKEKKKKDQGPALGWLCNLWWVQLLLGFSTGARSSEWHIPLIPSLKRQLHREALHEREGEEEKETSHWRLLQTHPQQPLPSSCLFLACWPALVHIASAVWKGLAAVSELQLHSLITGHYSGRVVTSEWQMEEK